MDLIEQGSQEWLNQRLGRFTGSEIHKLVVKEGLGAAAVTYTISCLEEETQETATEGYKSAAMHRGNQLEEEAADYYEFITGQKLIEVGFKPFGPYAGASADRLFENMKAGVEIKCPESKEIHGKHGIIESQKHFKTKHKDYYWQCLFNMMVWRCEYWDFLSYHPEAKYRMFRFRIYPDKDDAALLIRSIRNAVKNKNKIKKLWDKNKL